MEPSQRKMLYQRFIEPQVQLMTRTKYHRKWRQKNPDKVRKYKTKYYHRYPEKHREWAKKYYYKVRSIDHGKASAIAGAIARTSSTTIFRAVTVAKYGKKELLKMIDKGKISTFAAYKIVQSERKERESEIFRLVVKKKSRDGLAFKEISAIHKKFPNLKPIEKFGTY